MWGGSLRLEEKFLVEGLMFVAPLVSAAPAGVASICTVPTTGFKGEVQQVIQADFFGSSKLSRAKLGPACLCYLQSRNLLFLHFRMEAELFLNAESDITSSRRPPPATPYCRPPL